MKQSLTRCICNPYNRTYFRTNNGDQRIFTFSNHDKCLSLLFSLRLNTYVIGPRPLDLFNSFRAGRGLIVALINLIQCTAFYRQQLEQSIQFIT